MRRIRRGFTVLVMVALVVVGVASAGGSRTANSAGGSAGRSVAVEGTWSGSISVSGQTVSARPGSVSGQFWCADQYEVTGTITATYIGTAAVRVLYGTTPFCGGPRLPTFDVTSPEGTLHGSPRWCAAAVEYPCPFGKPPVAFGVGVAHAGIPEDLVGTGKFAVVSGEAGSDIFLDESGQLPYDPLPGAAQNPCGDANSFPVGYHCAGPFTNPNASGKIYGNITTRPPPTRGAGTGGGCKATKGSLIVYSSTDNSFGGNAEIWTIKPDGTCAQRLTDHPATDWFPDVSPNRKSVVWQSDRSGKNELYVMTSDGKHSRRLTKTPGRGESLTPVWSPDGKRIAFVSNRTGRYALWVMKADGSGARQIGALEAVSKSRPSWSPDGKQLAFAARPAGTHTQRIYVMRADGGGKPLAISPGNVDVEPAWSPDGEQIAYFSEQASNGQIWVMQSNGSNPRQVTAGGTVSSNAYQPAWSPDSTTLVYVQNSPTASQLYLMDADGSSLRPLTPPDGSRADEAPSWR